MVCLRLLVRSCTRAEVWRLLVACGERGGPGLVLTSAPPHLLAARWASLCAGALCADAAPGMQNRAAPSDMPCPQTFLKPGRAAAGRSPAAAPAASTAAPSSSCRRAGAAPLASSAGGPGQDAGFGNDLRSAAASLRAPRPAAPGWLPQRTGAGRRCGRGAAAAAGVKEAARRPALRFWSICCAMLCDQVLARRPIRCKLRSLPKVAAITRADAL